MESNHQPTVPTPLSLLLAEIEVLGYCPESNEQLIRTDISLPDNFPFECPVQRGSQSDPTFYLKKKAQWISEALGKKVSFTFPKTIENVELARMSVPVDATDPDPALYGYEKNGQILIVMPVHAWLKQGGKNWYKYGEFIERDADDPRGPLTPDQAIPVELKPAPADDELKAWIPFDLFDQESPDKH